MWKFKRISDMVEFFKKIICNDITIGNGEKNVIEFDKTKDSASRPKIRYSNETSRFQYTMNGVDWFNFGTSSSGDANTIEQVDVVAPESTQSTSPHIVDIPITYNVDFKRRDPSVLKFIAGVNNVTRSGCLFDLSDSTKFNLNEDGTVVGGHQSKYVVWDGQMKFKTIYIIPMQDSYLVSVTNTFGIETNYRVHRTTNIINGSIDIIAG